MFTIKFEEGRGESKGKENMVRDTYFLQWTDGILKIHQFFLK